MTFINIHDWCIFHKVGGGRNHKGKTSFVAGKSPLQTDVLSSLAKLHNYSSHFYIKPVIGPKAMYNHTNFCMSPVQLNVFAHWNKFCPCHCCQVFWFLLSSCSLAESRLWTYLTDYPESILSCNNTKKQPLTPLERWVKISVANSHEESRY